MTQEVKKRRNKKNPTQEGSKTISSGEIRKEIVIITKDVGGKFKSVTKHLRKSKSTGDFIGKGN